MNNFWNSIVSAVQKNWSKWSMMQRVTLIGVGVLLLAGFLSLFFLGKQGGAVALFGVSIRDQASLDQIALRLDQEGIDYSIGSDSKIYVNDQSTARRARTIIVQENLMPNGIDPWSVFDVQRWTTTQFENDVRLRQALTRSLEQHISSLSAIDQASVTLVLPKKQVLRDLQEPTTASVILTPKVGVDLLADRKQIQGIVRLISFAVGGLSEDNITIMDNQGNVLNDFDNLKDFDRLALGSKIIRERRLEEAKLTQRIYASLSKIISPDRVDIVNVAVDMDYVDRSVSTEKVLPVELKADNPNTPWDDSEVLSQAPLSTMKKEEHFEGSAFNPEGPAGQEGQTPPIYKELENQPGIYKQNQEVINYNWGKEVTNEVASPLKTSKISVSVAIDGNWEKVYDANGKVQVKNGSLERNYVPLSDEDLSKIRNLIAGAINLNTTRGDNVTVENISFDRSTDFATEDAEYFAKIQQERLLLIGALILVALILLTFAFRLIMQERERRRRQREEELARQHQAMREAALRAAEEDIANSQSSLMSNGNIQLQESAVTLTRDNPEAVANLVRLWIAEE